MTEKIELWGFSDNDRSGKVRWTAYELGLEVEEHRIELGEHRKDAYRELNPFAQIPTVKFRGRTLIESTAACHIMAEEVGEPKLFVAPGEAHREAFLFWCSLFAETTEARLVESRLAKVGVLPEQYFELHHKQLRFKLRIAAERIPSQGFLCGEQLTIADIIAGYNLRLALNTELIERDKVIGYVDRLRARPAAEKSRIFNSLKD